MTTAYIGIGSNLGDPRAAIDKALALLRQAPGLTLGDVSPLIETAPVGGPPDQPPFLNAACTVETSLEPEALLDVLQRIERDLGRRREERWGPRVIDLDILLYGDRIVANGRLIVPHLHMRERRFVLEPLSAIAPDAVDPVTGRTVRQLLEALG